ncbi:MAG: hypothetical protein RBR67_19150 [Desulfobacterium sp.]|jgi:hypothetical protein|nr:hypothetical protein [Desulfobacterium sp.]
MTYPLPEGENLRAAVRQMAQERKSDPDANVILLVDKVCMKFDLTPAEGEFLLRFVRDPENDTSC